MKKVTWNIKKKIYSHLEHLKRRMKSLGTLKKKNTRSMNLLAEARTVLSSAAHGWLLFLLDSLLSHDRVVSRWLGPLFLDVPGPCPLTARALVTWQPRPFSLDSPGPCPFTARALVSWQPRPLSLDSPGPCPLTVRALFPWRPFPSPRVVWAACRSLWCVMEH